MTLPAAYGGSAADTVTWTLCQEELARASASVAHTQLLCKLMGICCWSMGVRRSGSGGCRRWREGKPSVSSRRPSRVGALTWRGLQTTARATVDGWVLNGTKRFITAAMVCDLAIVVATTDRALGREGIALLLVEPGTAGFRHGRQGPRDGAARRGHRGAGVRRLPGAAHRAARQRAGWVQAGHGVAQRRPRGHRRRRRWAWPRPPSTRRSPTRRRAWPSGGRSPSCRPSSSCSPTCRRRSRPRGCWSGGRRA